MKKEGIKRGIAVLLTLGVIVLLLSAGPAEAIDLKLDIPQPIVDQGETITFIVTADVLSADQMEISDNFILRLNGPQLIECQFDIDGKNISGCAGMTIEKISSAPQNSYGYYDGQFKFKIIMDTASNPNGTYSTVIVTMINGVQKQEQGEDVTIRGFTGFEGCSIRANDGTVLVGEEDFNRPSINFHIPLDNAGDGKGTFSGQLDRSRISYKFNILSVQNFTNHVIIKIKGVLEINGSIKEKNKEATITYDKVNKQIDLVSTTGMSLDAENMKITFRKRC